jgi:hypothetical protein
MGRYQLLARRARMIGTSLIASGLVPTTTGTASTESAAFDEPPFRLAAAGGGLSSGSVLGSSMT